MRKLALSICALGLALPLCGSVWAAGNSGDPPAPPERDKSAATAQPAEAAQPAAAAATPALAAELAELRALLRSQAAEIEVQRRELAEMKARLAAPTPAPAPVEIAVIKPVAPEDTVSIGGSVLGSYVDAAPPQDKESPLALHFKGITLTPGGFAAAETVFRNRATDADVNTPFTSVPYSASNESKITEFNFSGRQSRIAMLMEGKISSAKIGGYYEGDFLSAGVTSNNRQSNSYTFRQRQFWAQARLDSGWIFTGGQMWSLVTETRKGMDNRTEATPLTIDAQYVAGFNWARQYGFRVVKNFNDKIWLGLSLEGAQEVLPTLGDATHGQAANFILQNTGNAGGLYNNTTNYTLNPAPDFIFKAVWEPGGGWGHWELFGLVRDFRARVFPCIVPANVTAPAACTGNPNTFMAKNDSSTGGGVGGGFRIPLFNKKLDVGAKGLYGTGVGRYGSSTLPDLTIKPRGTIAPLHAGSGLGTIEWHATSKLDVYLNGGGDYVSRAVYVTLAGTPTVPPVSIGYGSPFFVNSGCQSSTEVAPGKGSPNKAGNCTSDFRYVLEGTVGFWHRLYKGDRGTMQWGLQYSYLSLAAWSGLGTPGVAGVFPQFNPHSNDNMFFTSFRYYLP